MFNVYDYFRFTIFLFSSTSRDRKYGKHSGHVPTDKTPTGRSFGCSTSRIHVSHSFPFLFSPQKIFQNVQFQEFPPFSTWCLLDSWCLCLCQVLYNAHHFVCVLCVCCCLFCVTTRKPTPLKKMIFLKLTTKPEISSKTRVGV